MRRLLAALAGILSVVLVGPRAEAKLIPLEVQVSDDRTVRVPPSEFIERINVSGVRGRFGVFENEEGAPSVGGTPMEVRLIVFADRSGTGTVHESLGPDVVRETMVTLAYYRTSSGAVAQIKRPSADPFVVGRWVRITPAFVRMVNEALETAPAVEAVDPPLRPRRWEATSDPLVRGLVVLVMSVVLAICLFILLIASRIWRRAVERRASRAPSVP